MATPLKVKPVATANGYSIQGDFTYLPAPGSGGFQDVNLKCGKGMPLVKMPRVVWTRPAIRDATFPDLKTLSAQITTIMGNASADMTKAIDQAKANMSTYYDTLLKPYITSTQNGGKQGCNLPDAFSILFSSPIAMSIYKIEVGKGKYKVGYVQTSGVLLFRIAALNEIRKAIFGAVGADWWKAVVFTPLAILDLWEKLTSLEYNKQEMDAIIDTWMKAAMETMKCAFTSLLNGLASYFIGVITEIGNAIKGILTAITNALLKMTAALQDYASKVATAACNMGINAINEAMYDTVTTLNTILANIETAYNQLTQRFNTSVVEPLQCKVKELEDKIANIGIIKFPSIPGLPSIGFPGWGGGGIAPWAVSVTTILTSINAKLYSLDARVTALEKKV